MTNKEFAHIQDNVLQLSGRELAEKLCITASAITHWRNGNREIPPYIVELLHHLQAEHFHTLTLPLTIPEIIRLSRLAEERGETVESLLISMIRSAIAPDTTPAAPIPFHADSLRVAEDPVEYITTPRSKAVPALSPRPRSTPNPPKNTP